MNDVPILKVAWILGHRDVSTTMRYSHLADSSIVDAMDKLAVSMSVKSRNIVPLVGEKRPA